MKVTKFMNSNLSQLYLAYKYFIETNWVHFCYCKSEDIQAPACVLC